MSPRRRARPPSPLRRRILWGAAAAAAALAYAHFTSPTYLLSRLRAAVGGAWKGEILAERLGYTPWGGLVVDRLVLAAPGAGGLEIARLRVRFNPFRGLMGQSLVTDLEIESPTLLLPEEDPRAAFARWPFAKDRPRIEGDRRGALLVTLTDFRVRCGKEELLRVPQAAVRCAFLASAGVSDVTGEIAGPAWASGSFRVSYGTDGCRWDGALHGLRLLPETRGMLWPRARAAWDLFAPSGTVELVGRGGFQPGPSGASAFTIEATTRDGEITFRHFPLPFRGIHGTLSFDETGRVELRDLWGFGAGALTTCEGAAGGRDDPASLDLDLTVQGLPLAPGVLSAMPEGLRALREWSGAEGTVSGSLQILRTSAAPDAPSFLSTWWLRNLSLERLPMRPVVVEGSLDLRGRLEGHGVARLEGSLRVPRGELAGHALNACTGTFSQDGRRLRMDLAEARLAGGDLHASLERDLDDPELPTRAVLDLANARIEEIKQGSVLSDQAIHGNVSGHAELAWKGGDVRTLTGRGVADLKDGYLFSLPPLSRTLALLSLNLGEQDPVIRSGRMAFRIQGDRMKLDLLELPSDQVTVRAHGILSRDGRVDLRVIANPGGSGVLSKIPVLKETTGGIRRFLGWVQDRGLFVFRVKGSVREPSVEEVRLFGLANKEVRLYHDLLQGRPAPEEERE